MQVIWAIGASMVVLAVAQFLGRKACLALGAIIVLGHNALDGHWPVPQSIRATPRPPLWVALHVSMSKVAGRSTSCVLYPLLPWIGVMLLGFGASVLFERAATARDRALLRWGVAITGAFCVLRLIDGYGEPNHWQAQARGAGDAHRLPEHHEVSAQPAVPAHDARSRGDLLRVRGSHARLAQGHAA